MSCLKAFEQARMKCSGATVVKENTIKLDGIALFTRLPSLPPDQTPGTRINVEVLVIDLLDMDFGCRFDSLEVG
jgi:hypothetical protein